MRPRTLAIGLTAAAILGASVALTVRAKSPAAPAAARFPGSRTIIPMGSLLASPRLAEPIDVAIVRDEAAARYHGSPAKLDTIIGAWRDALRAAGANVRVLRSSALGAAGGVRVVVIPSAPCMTVATRELIARATARGQGLIVTGVAGTHDAGCREIGYGLITELTGASRAEMLEPREMVYVTIPSRSPLAADIPPGARIELDPGRQVALRLPGRDAYYSGYTLEPLPAAERPLVDGAVAHSTASGARVVYWGFDLADASPLPWTREVLALLVRNSASWAAGAPIVEIEPWPRGFRAAAVIAQDVEDQFANAEHALDSLRAAGIRSTFYLTSDIALRNRRLTRTIAEHAEVGTHSENHRVLGGASRDEQRTRLELTQRDLGELVGRPILGLRPPQEQFDRATMAAWLAAGGSYLFGANNARVAAPELLEIDGDTLVLFGRVSPDDFIAAAPGASRDPEQLAETFLHEFAKVRALGGLFLFSYHSQLFARPEYVPIVARVARAVAADTTVWLATAAEVADWWRARSSVRVRATIAGGRLRISARNDGTTATSEAVVRVVLSNGWVIGGSPDPVSARIIASAGGATLISLPDVLSGSGIVVTVPLARSSAAP
jgi:peptidoglycan/xylan/chitin deacetylase (PgdA/CDA1 family)